MGSCVVRRWLFIIVTLAVGLLASIARADKFQLTTGESVEGELLPASATDQGVQIKVGEGQYQKVPWPNFTQEDLKKFKQIPKLTPFVEPYIEITQEERIKKTEVPIKQPPRLELPPKGSLFGAMFSSGLGIFILLLLYAAIIYAGYEVAVFRGQSVPLVAGLSAVPFLGFFVPIAFLCIPTKIQQAQQPWETGSTEPTPTIGPGSPAAAAAAAARAAEGGDEPVNPMQGEVQHPAGLRLHAEAESAQRPAHPPTQTFQRGQFTFNRRFFETKFPGFFSVVRHGADKDMVLLIKAARGEYLGQRIARIAQQDLHLEIHVSGASQEVMIPFQEIKEIQLKHKDAA
jgi:hypothetical protein